MLKASAVADLLATASEISGKETSRSSRTPDGALRDAVVGVVARGSNGGGMRITEIACRIQRKPREIAPQLMRLVARGVLSRPSRGLYAARCEPLDPPEAVTTTRAT